MARFGNGCFDWHRLCASPVEGSSKKRPSSHNQTVGSSVGRGAEILFLIAALAVVALWSDADKVWLVGSLAATYGLWFFWRMKQILSREE